MIIIIIVLPYVMYVLNVLGTQFSKHGLPSCAHSSLGPTSHWRFYLGSRDAQLFTPICSYAEFIPQNKALLGTKYLYTVNYCDPLWGQLKKIRIYIYIIHNSYALPPLRFANSSILSAGNGIASGIPTWNHVQLTSMCKCINMQQENMNILFTHLIKSVTSVPENTLKQRRAHMAPRNSLPIAVACAKTACTVRGDSRSLANMIESYRIDTKGIGWYSHIGMSTYFWFCFVGLLVEDITLSSGTCNPLQKSCRKLQYVICWIVRSSLACWQNECIESESDHESQVLEFFLIYICSRWLYMYTAYSCIEMYLRTIEVATPCEPPVSRPCSLTSLTPLDHYRLWWIGICIAERGHNPQDPLLVVGFNSSCGTASVSRISLQWN